MQNPSDYSFLNQVLADFLEQKGASARDRESGRYENSQPALQERIDFYISQGMLTEEEIKTHVFGLESMPYEKLRIISELQTHASRFSHIPPLQFQVTPVQKPSALRALEWTVVQLHKLNLAGLDPIGQYQEFQSDNLVRSIIHEYFEIEALTPYNQCYWCGYIDLSGKKLGKKNKHFCHADDCTQTSNSNPSEHPNCCAGQWGLAKRAFTTQLDYYKPVCKKPKQWQEKIKEVFLDFCNRRYQDNVIKTNDIIDKKSYQLQKLILCRFRNF